MSPLATPVAAEFTDIEAADVSPDYPVGLDTDAPDDLGAWWLDLGFIDLADGLAA